MTDHQRVRKLPNAIGHVPLILSMVFATVLSSITNGSVHAFDWVPTDEEIQKYRKSWNPLSNGPIFVGGVDIHPKGQLTVHLFIFSQISEKRFDNDLSFDRKAAQTHSYQLHPLVTTTGRLCRILMDGGLPSRRSI